MSWNQRTIVISTVVATIVAVSVITGVILLPTLTNLQGSSSSAYTSTTQPASTETRATSTVEAVTFEDSSSSSSLSSYSSTNTISNSTSPSSSTYSVNESTLSSGESTSSSRIGTGGSTWLIDENFTIMSPNNSPIYCGSTGASNPTYGTEQAICNQLIDNNSTNTIAVASFGLSVSGANNSEWQFNVGVTRGQGPENYTWKFGDGMNESSSGPNSTVTHAYAASGIYETTVGVLIMSPFSASNSTYWKIYIEIAIYVHVAPQGQFTTTTNTETNATTIVLDVADGPSVCSFLFDGVVGTGGWNSTTNTCTLSGDPILSPTFLVNRGITLLIDQNVTLVLANPGHGFANYGTIVNNGTMIFENTFTNYGTLLNNGNITNYNGDP